MHYEIVLKQISMMSQAPEHETPVQELLMCIICGDHAAVKFLNCDHQSICLECTTQLDESICPMCRSPIKKVVLPNTNEEVCMQDIVTYKQAVNRDTLIKCFQLHVLGSDYRGKNMLAKKLMERFPMPSQSGESSHPFRSVYKPCMNVFGRGIHLRVSRFRLPELEDSSEIAADYPDAILICLQMRDVDFVEQFAEWSDTSPNGIVPKIFLMMPPDVGNDIDDEVILKRFQDASQWFENNPRNVSLIDMSKSESSLDASSLMEKIIPKMVKSRTEWIHVTRGGLGFIGDVNVINSEDNSTPYYEFIEFE